MGVTGGCSVGWRGGYWGMGRDGGGSSGGRTMWGLQWGWWGRTLEGLGRIWGSMGGYGRALEGRKGSGGGNIGGRWGAEQDGEAWRSGDLGGGERL